MEVVLPPAQYMVSQITCLICHRIPSDSLIYLCSNGHLYCSTCCGSLKGKKCRMNCKETLKKSFEPILQDIYQNCRFPCNYPLCREKVQGKNLQFHQSNCHYSPIKCPECQQTVQFERYMEHLEKIHQVGINFVFENDAVQNICINFPPIESYSISHFHNFQGEKFFIHTFVKPKECFIFIQYFGEYRRELEYSATICLKNTFGHKTEVTLPINPITASFSQIQKTLSYAHFSKEHLECYLNYPQLQQNHLQKSFNSDKIEYNNNNNNNNNVYPAFVTFSINFSHNFLRTFRQNLYQDIHFGTESYC